MALYTYTGYIPSLQPSSPTATDAVSEGDDHIRGLAKTLATTFSGFTEASQAVTVTASDINAACTSASVVGASPLVQVGMILPYAGTTALSNLSWLVCDGIAVSRTNYAKLFAVIGTTYGAGDGSTTFNVPDLRGYFVRGLNTTATGVDPNRVNASKQTSDNLSHTHPVTVTASSHTHTMPSGGDHTHTTATHQHSGGGTTTGSGNFAIQATTLTTNAGGAHTHTIDASSHTHLASTTGTGGFESRPYNLALRHYIKAA